MKFFVVFALVAAASASPLGLGSWQLTDNGWQFLPLTKGLVTSPPAPTDASTTVASTLAVTSPSTEAVTTPSNVETPTTAKALSDGESTTVALSEGLTTPLNVDEVTTTTIASTSPLNVDEVTTTTIASTSPLNVDEVTTTTIASTSANIVGHDDSGDSSSTTTPGTVINVGTVNVISSRLDSATVPSTNNETSQSLGNDIDGSASALNATAPTTTPIASSTPMKFGNNVDGLKTEFSETTPITTTTISSINKKMFGNDIDGSTSTLDATNSPSTVSFKLGNDTINVNSSAPTINIETININNELDDKSSNFKLGHDLDASPSTFNTSTPAKLSNEAEDIKTTTPSINIGTININNNASSQMADWNVTTTSTITPSTMRLGNDMDSSPTGKTINIDSTIPTINVGTVNVNNRNANDSTQMADFNVTTPSTTTMKLGNDVDSTPTTLPLNSATGKTINVNSTIPTINIDTVNINNAMDSNATALNSSWTGENATTTVAPASAMKLGNDIDGTTSAFNASSTPASSPVKLGENRDSVHPQKKTVVMTTVSSAVKELKPNTCIISEHASDHADCRRRADGDFFRNTQDCSMYFRCAHGLRMQCACPLGTVFSQLTTVCDYEWAVPECNSDPQDWQPQLTSTTYSDESEM